VGEAEGMSTEGKCGGYGLGTDARWPPNIYGPLEVDAPGRGYGSVDLPHQCDEWTIGYGPKAEVIARMDMLIVDLQAARVEVEEWER
jgi:hypothetical protein